MNARAAGRPVRAAAAAAGSGTASGSAALAAQQVNVAEARLESLIVRANSVPLENKLGDGQPADGEHGACPIAARG